MKLHILQIFCLSFLIMPLAIAESVAQKALGSVPLVSELHSNSAVGVNVSAGRYIMKLDVYVSPGTTMDHFYTRIGDGNSTSRWDLGTVAAGTWVELEQQVRLLNHASEVRILFPNHPEYGGGTGSVFIDNIQLYEDTTEDALEENNQIVFSVYPNPASEQVTIRSAGAAHIAIYTPGGICLYEEQTHQGNTVINTSGYCNGLYLVKLSTETGVNIKSFVIHE